MRCNLIYSLSLAAGLYCKATSELIAKPVPTQKGCLASLLTFTISAMLCSTWQIGYKNPLWTNSRKDKKTKERLFSYAKLSDQMTVVSDEVLYLIIII